jgi:hypothetical protein
MLRERRRVIARARIRRNRCELELLSWSGTFGPVTVERDETIEEFAAKVGCSVADLLASHAVAADDERDIDDGGSVQSAGRRFVGRRPLDAAQKGSVVSVPSVKKRSQADRFADFMADSAAHGPPIARGTARRFLAEHAVEITGNVVRFADGSAIERADVLLAEAR